MRILLAGAFLTGFFAVSSDAAFAQRSDDDPGRTRSSRTDSSGSSSSGGGVRYYNPGNSSSSSGNAAAAILGILGAAAASQKSRDDDPPPAPRPRPQGILHVCDYEDGTSSAAYLYPSDMDGDRCAKGDRQGVFRRLN